MTQSCATALRECSGGIGRCCKLPMSQRLHCSLSSLFSRRCIFCALGVARAQGECMAQLTYLAGVVSDEVAGKPTSAAKHDCGFQIMSCSTLSLR
eukprot:148008-Amphidinium_carterae.1